MFLILLFLTFIIIAIIFAYKSGKFTKFEMPPPSQLMGGYSEFPTNEVGKISSETWQEQLDFDAHLYADYKQCSLIGGKWDNRSSSCGWTKSLCELHRDKFNIIIQKMANGEDIKKEDWDGAIYAIWNEKEKTCMQIPFFKDVFANAINEKKKGEIEVDYDKMAILCTKRDGFGRCINAKFISEPCITIRKKYCNRKKIQHDTSKCGYCYVPTWQIFLELIIGKSFTQLQEERFNQFTEACKNDPASLDCLKATGMVMPGYTLGEMGIKTTQIETVRLAKEVNDKCSKIEGTNTFASCAVAIWDMNPVVYINQFAMNYLNGIATSLGIPNVNSIVKDAVLGEMAKVGDGIDMAAVRTARGFEVAYAWSSKNGVKVAKFMGADKFVNALANTGTNIASMFVNTPDEDLLIDFLKDLNGMHSHIFTTLKKVPGIKTFVNVHKEVIGKVGGAIEDTAKSLCFGLC